MGRFKLAALGVLCGAGIALLSAVPAEAQSCQQRVKAYTRQMQGLTVQQRRTRGNKAAFCAANRRAVSVLSQTVAFVNTPAGRCVSRASARKLQVQASRLRAATRQICS